VLYAYGGWNDAAFVAAEVRDPKRNIPRALIFGIGSITAIYVLINLAYILGMGFQADIPRESSLPTELMRKALGDDAGKAINVIIMISAIGAVNGLIFTGSRVYATLGADHTLFGFLGRWKPGRGAPILALLLQAIITLGMVFLFGTERGHNYINQFLDWLNGNLTTIAEWYEEGSVVRIDYEKDWDPGSAFKQLVSHSSPAFWSFFLLTGFSLFSLRAQNLLLLGLPLYWLSQLLGGNRAAEVK
jgi:amino acid transporter